MSNRIVKLPPIESFGHLTPDKWLLLKTLEEAAEMVEAGKRLVKGDSKARRDLIAEWADVYVSKTVYPTAESYGTLAGILRMLANDVEIMAHEKEMGGRR